MKRFALEKLKKWQERSDKKPLIIHGARQVGKTWLMKKFGKTQYKNVAYICFEKNERMENLFSGDMDTKRLLIGLEAETRQKIIPLKTLVIFDEIQECPNALTSLKYFNENVPEYDITAAGSLLGIFLHKGVSFPVGKVDFMDLHPISFCEFLEAMGEKKFCKMLDNLSFDLIKVFREKFLSYLRMYFYIGGMPEAVQSFVSNRDFLKVREIQKKILRSYENDFSKHIPKDQIQKVSQIWNSIPAQLAKENKKFVYSEVKKGARAKTFEYALEWLIRGGLIYRVARVTKPAIPLKSYEGESGAFKLFMVDIGLMAAQAEVDSRAILEGDRLFTEFKGALSEQFVCQELKTLEDIYLAYWANEAPAQAEVDFVLQFNCQVIPVEVKSVTNLRAKSLPIYHERFQPEVEIRTSQADFKITDNLCDVPLYALDKLKQIIDHFCKTKQILT
ncbi:MAG: ATP-binding protein [Puniceicoccales bacterium]|jgi:predicted AAA+ superfamily ATPase|nr:ATP-binding protein [Puniceicoccales bacterium]